MQKVLFPGTHMRITQDEYGRTSHRDSLARDDGGESMAFDSPVLAPFDGYFARVRPDSSHETYFVSDGPVECANGYVGVVTFLFMHDSVNRFSTGTHAKQGDVIGYEGGFGGGKKDRFAHHTHREWSKGKNITQTRNPSGTYVIADQMHEYDVCFLRPDTMVYTGAGFTAARALKSVRDNMGHAFKIWEEETEMSVPALSGESIIMEIGPASAGDRTAVSKLAASLGLGYSENADGMMFVGPASTGDQVTVLRKTAALGLPYGIYELPEESNGNAAEDAQTAQIAKLEKLLAEAEKHAQEATARAEKADKLTAEEKQRADSAEQTLEHVRQAAQMLFAALSI